MEIMMERKTTMSKASSPGRPFIPSFGDYREHGIFAVHEDVPGLGVKAGDPGVIAGVYEDGRLLNLEIAREDGTSAGFVDVRIDDRGMPHVVGYSALSTH
jgi:hypothetical protein